MNTNIYTGCAVVVLVVPWLYWLCRGYCISSKWRPGYSFECQPWRGGAHSREAVNQGGVLFEEIRYAGCAMLYISSWIMVDSLIISLYRRLHILGKCQANQHRCN